jgi:uncharacterized Zn finger protein
VSIELRPLTDHQWDTVFDALADQAIFAAQLLNGEMPADIEQAFEAVQIPLFPASSGDLQTDCSCPDWANPCKHIAATYYLLGERFDEDPFLLFELRGRDKGQVMAALCERRARGVASVSEAPALYAIDAVEAVEATALVQCLDRYWALGTGTQEVELDIAPPKVEMELLKRLSVPGYLEARSFSAQMGRVYEGVTQKAIKAAYASRRDAGLTPVSTEEQLAVLTMVDEGVVSVEEAVMLLNALAGVHK